MPLGTGGVDVGLTVKMLKSCGYDETITLEVFTPDRRHLAYSRDVLRKAWDEFSLKNGRPGWSPAGLRGSAYSVDGICSLTHGLVIRQHSFQSAECMALLQAG